MGSLLLLLFIAVILAVLLWIVIKVPWWAKPLVIIITFLAVTADGYLGRRKLEKMCQEQGGLHIYKTVNNVEGFEEKGESPEEFWIKNGYLFIEGDSKVLGKVNRLTLQQNGEIILEKDTSPKSQYYTQYYTNAQTNVKDYYIHNRKIIERNTGEVLAEVNTFGYRGGWIQRFMSSLFASKAPVKLCPDKQRRHLHFKFWKKTIVNILKPKKEEK